MLKFIGIYMLRKCSQHPVLRDRPVCLTYCMPQLVSVQVITYTRSYDVQSKSLLLKSVLIYALGAQKINHIEMVLVSIHNICLIEK